MRSVVNDLLWATGSIRRESALAILGTILEHPQIVRSSTLQELLRERDPSLPSIYEHVIEPIMDGAGASAEALRNLFGWRADTVGGISGMAPHFWNLIGTWPPRDRSLAVTIAGMDPQNLQRKHDTGECAEIIDVGFATALVAKSMRRAGYSIPIHGIEVDERWIALAEKTGLPSFTVERADVASLADIDRYAAAISFMVHHHVENLEASLACLYRALRPGATFSIADLTVESAADHPATGSRRDDQGPEILTLDDRTTITVDAPPPGIAGAHVRPHPPTSLEWRRNAVTLANALRGSGFDIITAARLDPMVVHFTCVKPVR